MPTANVRPDHLPDFTAPPLNEVVLGMQFSTPQGYQQIFAGEVWNLFKTDYPNIQELPALEPAFETFGPSLQSMMRSPISIISGCTHDRFWFSNANDQELIQFQQDRLLHNWRQRGDNSNAYPRFECMVGKFEKELAKLECYFESFSKQPLAINQCEISYVNHIPLDSVAGESVSDWIEFIDFSKVEADDFTFTGRQVVRDKVGKPVGRFYFECALGFLPTGKRVIVLSLSVKGAPLSPTIKAGIEFLGLGREEIVTNFAKLTTLNAHKKWGRTK